MIGHVDVWTGTSTTEVSSLIQFLGNRSNGHRYFTQEDLGEEGSRCMQRADSHGRSSAVSA
jgi:hypothetical protein